MNSMKRRGCHLSPPGWRFTFSRSLSLSHRIPAALQRGFSSILDMNECIQNTAISYQFLIWLLELQYLVKTYSLCLIDLDWMNWENCRSWSHLITCLELFKPARIFEGLITGDCGDDPELSASSLSGWLLSIPAENSTFCLPSVLLKYLVSFLHTGDPVW